MKEVRIVTNRSGKPKGYAYIEYLDEVVFFLHFYWTEIVFDVMSLAFSRGVQHTVHRPDPSHQGFEGVINKLRPSDVFTCTG